MLHHPVIYILQEAMEWLPRIWQRLHEAGEELLVAGRFVYAIPNLEMKPTRHHFVEHPFCLREGICI
ncbi:hypothetical protein ATB53_05030 [Xanthomonas translucens]|uniref:Uncharacterized protein n=1 Tax=Xanthomonas campestris pv. translucens TaxID=343 RepID=A0A120EWB5_XANCT|nr:hypothetical protein ATB53_05030 [Xanthomonas translucens]